MNYSNPVTRYVVGKLSVLTDQQIKQIDFELGISAIDSADLPNEEKETLKRILLAIQKEVDIYHHGVKGMKWGVRRYQNKDGSLTPAGQKKYRDDEAKKTIFGTAKTFAIKTRSGETLTAEPVKPPSIGTKIFNAIMGTPQKEEMGYRGDANYTMTDSKGNKIGELSLISKDADTAYLDWITVDKKQRGKGYATDIINDIVSQARESGYKKLELNALKKPRPLYERIGFTYTDPSKMNIMDRITSFEFGCKRMEYDLTSNSKKRNAVSHSNGILEKGSICMSEYELCLYHHGVKGMKWGVRKKRESSSGGPTERKSWKQRRADKKAARELQRRQNKWVSNVNKNWLNAHNKAADEFNIKIKDINEKYGDKATTSNKDYVNEVGRTWKDLYSKALISDFGDEPISKGRNWVENMPFMDAFDEFDD